jgi:hypothetical protein
MLTDPCEKYKSYDSEEIERYFGDAGSLMCFAYYRQDSSGDAVGLIGVVAFFGVLPVDVTGYLTDSAKASIREEIREIQKERVLASQCVVGDRDWS